MIQLTKFKKNLPRFWISASRSPLSPLFSFLSTLTRRNLVVENFKIMKHDTVNSKMDGFFILKETIKNC